MHLEIDFTMILSKENWKKIFSSGWFWSSLVFLYFIIDSIRRGLREDIIFFTSLWMFVIGLFLIMKDKPGEENKRDTDATAIGLVLLILAFVILVYNIK